MSVWWRRRWPWLVLAAVGLAGGAGLSVFLLGDRDDGRVIEHGPRDRPQIALTFDADMTRTMATRLAARQVASSYDAAIVRELQDTRTPATFFVTGLWALTYPAVVRLLAGDPLFEIANHSMDHAAFTPPCFGLPVVPSESLKRWQLTRTAGVLRETAGVTTRYFRFPGGCHDAADLRLVRELRHQAVGWDVLSGDAFERDPAAVARNVVDGARPGSIIVMHLNGAPHAPATAEALRAVIPALRARGLRFVTLSELFAEPAGGR